VHLALFSLLVGHIMQVFVQDLSSRESEAG
jgi:hypothetical protein